MLVWHVFVLGGPLLLVPVSGLGSAVVFLGAGPPPLALWGPGWGGLVRSASAPCRSRRPRRRRACPCSRARAARRWRATRGTRAARRGAGTSGGTAGGRRRAGRTRAVVAYDARGCGESEGTQTYGGFNDEVRDLRRVIDHVTNALGLPVALVFGHSRGGTVALLHAARFGGVPAVAVAAARANLKEGIQERLGDAGVAAIGRGETVELPAGPGRTTTISPKDVAERLLIDMRAELDLVADTSFLLLEAKDDSVVPAGEAARIRGMLPPRLPAEAVVLAGCHRFRGVEASVASRVAAFARALRAASASPAPPDAAPPAVGRWRDARRRARGVP